MGTEVHLWRVGNADDELIEIESARLNLESRLEEWLERDISILDRELMVTGRQVPTVGGPIDILCINPRCQLRPVALRFA